ncbi:glutamine synthetase [Polychaeton citri CBS 116435]|uniref:Glutamine synthetase n=1 Tax=Polychaeton citri CBS 116435 TaxID=1314669 RepID=A0A9P4URI8_9PEZI|nr:glutamine synthetase [Polychaeton citri CBS 116435]
MVSNQETLEAFLEETGSFKFIRVQWVDYSGVLRVRFVPVERCLRIADGSESACLAQSSMLVPISTAPRIFSISDYHETWFLRPDWSSLRKCGFKPDHAAVMSFVDQKDAEKRFDKCPRMLLKQAVERLGKHWGSTVLVGFEIEFVLLDESNDVIKPLDRLNGYSRTAGLRAETLEAVEEIANSLERSCIGIHQFHAEVGDQLEIALAPEPALAAVDSLVLAQETIRTIFVRRNIRATMTPKPLMTGPLNGLHLHLSLDRLEDALADNFLAGVLEHMSSLCAFGMANFDSYDRSVADCTGEWIGFGTDNRDLPVRRVGDHHWEIRMMDSTANPYLFTAAVLLAGLDGLEGKRELTWKDCQVFPSLLDEHQRAEYGLNRRMPATFQQALDCLRSDSAIKSQIGEEMLTWYVSVKDKEVEEFVKMTDEERRLRFLEYF